jgi:hypothetical protein
MLCSSVERFFYATASSGISTRQLALPFVAVREFVVWCRGLNLFADALVGSTLKCAPNS